MLPEWRRALHKVSDVVLECKAGQVYWPCSAHESLIIGICFPFHPFLVNSYCEHFVRTWDAYKTTEDTSKVVHSISHLSREEEEETVWAHVHIDQQEHITI